MARLQSMMSIILGLCIMKYKCTKDLTTSSVKDARKCSFHQHFSCHADATCHDLPGGGFKCVCHKNSTGDGLKGLKHTGCTNTSQGIVCLGNSSCHRTLGFCNSQKICQCLSGFVGNGVNKCDDIDECKTIMCDTNARCRNFPGSFECICNPGYKGNGLKCEGICQDELDCDKNATCRNFRCICFPGYEGSGKSCIDIDECKQVNKCHKLATCENTGGSYKCHCPKGYIGDGEICVVKENKYWKNCHEIILASPNSKSGEYTIDPDGAGKLPQIKVTCKMRKGLGITVVKTNRFPITLTRKSEISQPDVNKTNFYHFVNVTYEISEEYIQTIVDQSKFCYQQMSFKCFGGASFLGLDMHWIDVSYNVHHDWGSISPDRMCPCGKLGYCRNVSNLCNCDGSLEPGEDRGKILDKELLPVREVFVGWLPERQSMSVYLGPVLCGPKYFDIPRDCWEAWQEGVRKDGPEVVDIDGPDGPLNYTLVHCDMTSEKYFGITVVPHGSIFQKPLVNPGEIRVKYNIDSPQIKALMEFSTFCSQEMNYECQNSSLLANGSSFWINGEGVQQNYWPGGNDMLNTCACGVLGSCDVTSALCNCQILDGVRRQDFGLIFNKSDLPVLSMTFNDIGPNKFGKPFLGPLRCSRVQFGIERTCHKYQLLGITTRYSYYIDPDGPVQFGEPKGKNLSPFLADCKMILFPPYGITIIYPDQLVNITTNGLTYRSVTFEQLIALTSYSYICSQDLKYQCKAAPLHKKDGTLLLKWSGPDGKNRAFLHGNNTDSCLCGLSQTCSGGKDAKCNCDNGDATTQYDESKITAKDFLPIKNLVTHAVEHYGEASKFQVGPLSCYDLYPNCKILQTKYVSADGSYTIDPDGPFGVEPFMVTCRKFKTIVEVNNKVVSKELSPSKEEKFCFNVQYKHNVTAEQIVSLVNKSGYCRQYMKYGCRHNPATGQLSYKTCNGISQRGWAGSVGMDSCQCGVTGTCDGNQSTMCNCDVGDNILRSDAAYLYNKDRLPVCEVCVSINPVTSKEAKRYFSILVAELTCSESIFEFHKSCQDYREKGIQSSADQYFKVSSKMQIIPLHCEMISVPPVGAAVIFPKKKEIAVSKDGGHIRVTYFVYKMEYIKEIIQLSVYCEQEIYIQCQSSAQKPVRYLGFSYTNSAGTTDIKWERTEECNIQNCSCILKNGSNKMDFGVIVNNKELPLSRIILGPSAGPRQLVIGALKCYEIYKDCQEIKDRHKQGNSLKNNIYAIDPDRAHGQPYFAAKCDLSRHKRFAVTEIPVISQTFFAKKMKQLAKIIYLQNSTYQQIHSLVNISKHCHQNLQFTCVEMVMNDITNPTKIIGYNDQVIPSFGTGPFDKVDGCPCVITGTCPNNTKCHCSAKSLKLASDQGTVLEKDFLPLTQVQLGQLTSLKAMGKLEFGPLRCTRAKSDLPKDCEEARKLGYQTGEILINPEFSKPFFVYCDMDLDKRQGITIINHSLAKKIKLNGTKDLFVYYSNVTDKQLTSLFTVSAVCYQPVKYDCFAADFTELEKFSWIGIKGHTKHYLGSTNTTQCTCGTEKRCGGRDGKFKQLTRKCNCLVGDKKWRADAAILSNIKDIPVKMIKVDLSRRGSSAYLTLGKLYCGHKPFDLDECKLGFHDCHPNAVCLNTKGHFKCYCKSGFRALGVSNVWANGRECIDNNECHLKYCPWSATCKNTIGSFICTCKQGFRQTGPLSCIDINECDEGLHNCDINARCVNTPGQFFCRCKSGYRGHGTRNTCLMVGLCSCFGDPHCHSFDKKWLHFQDGCRYTMVTDACENNKGKSPRFKVEILNWDRDTGYPVSWVKEATVFIDGMLIQLLQNRKVRVNNIAQNLPYSVGSLLHIQTTAKMVKIITSLEVEVHWDGLAFIKIVLPSKYQNRTCGICGNFNSNPDDDWKVGPGCSDLQNRLTTSEKIFANSWLVNDTSVKDYKHCASWCDRNDTTKIDHNCSDSEYAMAKSLCSYLMTKTKKLKECTDIMDKEMKKSLLDSCIFDACTLSDLKPDSACPAADALLEICEEILKVSIGSYRSGLCPMVCGENMKYKECGYESQRKSCVELMKGISTKDGPCTEGCFCMKGYFYDSEIDGCVPQDKCGCFYKDSYYSFNQTIVGENCGSVGRCSPNGNATFTSFSCQANSSCSIKDGILGCHCLPGFYQNGSECKVDRCKQPGHKCPNNSVCINRDDGFKCECNPGFTSNCYDCNDIDECATKIHECNNYADCVNTIGSYKCKCKQGFTMYKRHCKDINECSYNLHNCTSNSKCFNTIGSHVCKCCHGYTKNSVGVCVATGKLIPGEQIKCCACHGYLCNLKGKVCGSDGKTYNSRGDLIIASCEKGKKINALYKGSCQKTCRTTKCPHWQECQIDSSTKKPKCVCESCTEKDMTSDPVCSNRFVTFRNKCFFRKFQCLYGIEQHIVESKNCKGIVDKAVGSWSEWSPCSVTCGHGQQTKSRKPLRPLNKHEAENIPQKISAKCYKKPCVDGPCYQFNCSRPGEVCVVVNATAVCQCPDCKNLDIDPVCVMTWFSKYSHSQQTYQSQCKAERRACLRNHSFEILQPEPCDQEPVNCSLAMLMKEIRTDNCTSGKPVNVGTCLGGCGIRTGNCCELIRKEKRTVELTCPSGIRKKEEVEVMLECQCIPEPFVATTLRP